MSSRLLLAGLSLPSALLFVGKVYADAGYRDPADTRPAATQPNTGSLTTSVHKLGYAAYAFGCNLFGTLAAAPPAESFLGPIDTFLPPNLRDIFISERHGCAVDAKGDLYQWGSGYFCGELGTPECTLQGRALTNVTGNSKVLLALNAGALYAVPVSKAETRETEDLLIPSPAAFQKDERFVKVLAGEHHAAALTNTGRLFTARLSELGNYWGQLGRGADSTTKQVDVRSRQELAEQRAKEFFHAFMETGDVPPLATNLAYLDIEPKASTYISTAAEIVFGEVERFSDAVADFAVGEAHTVFKSRGGRLFAFGRNDQGQSGMVENNSLYDAHYIAAPREIACFWPGRVKPSDSAIGVLAAGGHTTAFSVEHAGSTQVFVCGSGLHGQHGAHRFQHHTLGTGPMLVPLLSNRTFFDEAAREMRSIRVGSLQCGGSHLAAVVRESDGLDEQYGADVYVWGGNRHSQLGNGLKSNRPFPLQVFHPRPKGDAREAWDDEVAGLSFLDVLLGNLGFEVKKERRARARAGDDEGAQVEPLKLYKRNGAFQRLYCGHDCTLIY